MTLQSQHMFSLCQFFMTELTTAIPSLMKILSLDISYSRFSELEILFLDGILMLAQVFLCTSWSASDAESISTPVLPEQCTWP